MDFFYSSEGSISEMEPFTRKFLKYSAAGRTVGVSASLSLTIQSWKLLAATRLCALLVAGVPLLDVGESNLLQAFGQIQLFTFQTGASDFTTFFII